MLTNYLRCFSLATFCIISIIMGIKFKPIIPSVVQFVHNHLIINFSDVSLITRVAHAFPRFSLSEPQRKDPLMKTRLIILSSEWLQKGILLRNRRVGSPFVLFPSFLKHKVKPHNECLYLHFRVLFMPNMPL